MTAPAKLHYRIETDYPVAFLTIDDGYAIDPLAVDDISNNNVPVTQFLTYYAASAGAYPPPTSGPQFEHLQQLRRCQTGNADQRRVGCHGKEHIDFRPLALAEQQTQMGAAADWLGGADMFSGRPRLFRPPYGTYNGDTLQAASNAGMPHVILWTHVAQFGTITNEWGSPRLRGGDIILLHHPNTDAVASGYLLEQLNSARAFMAAANLVPAYLHDFL